LENAIGGTMNRSHEAQKETVAETSKNDSQEMGQLLLLQAAKLSKDLK
jgi:hypothetical protein